MRISDLFEAEKKKKLAVIYGGRFQPFHKGHFQAYNWLRDKFGADNVWLATSDKTNFDPKKGDVSPFSFKEKKEIIVGLYDIPERRVIQATNPAFSPGEVLDQYQSYAPIYITAVGSKDKERYEKAEGFKPLPTSSGSLKNLQPAVEGVSYYTIIPEMGKGMSGTEVRDQLLSAEDEAARTKIFKRYFGKYDPVISAMILAKLKEVK